MQCPRQGCKNEAQQSKTYGILPCQECQVKDNLGRRSALPYEFASLQQSHRVQAQRDGHVGDLLQPYIGGSVNPDFFKRYPDKVSEYGVAKELEKL